MTAIRVIDFETTGIPGDGNDGPAQGPHEIVEIGWCDVIVEDDFARIRPQKLEIFCQPRRPIPPEASAVHHLTERSLYGCQLAEAGLKELERRTTESGISILAAHNSRFDQKFWDGGGRPWIDTYRCALRVWPHAPRHGNQVLRYWLKLDEQGGVAAFDPDCAVPSHRAGPDAYVTAHILAQMLADFEVEQLVEWSSVPALLPRCNFGKHRGSPWSEVPKDYLRWILDKSGMDDEDVLNTARHYLR